MMLLWDYGIQSCRNDLVGFDCTIRKSVETSLVINRALLVKKMLLEASTVKEMTILS
jgi:hypothetical protein